MADKKKAAPKSDAEKSKAFVETAQIKMTRALRAIEALASLANSRRYVYTPEQIGKIGAALETACEKVRMKFTGKGGEEQFKF